jgi:RNA polymerase sigma factor (sigma-70 family)
MNQFSDEELYSRISKHQDPEMAFNQLYRRHSGPLFRFIYRFTANGPEAEEILHDLFLQLLQGKFHLGEDANLKSWLYTVARNKGLNLCKQRSQRRQDSSSLEELPDDQNLEQDFEHQNLLDRLQVATKKLPDDLNQTWQLRRQGIYKKM